MLSNVHRWISQDPDTVTRQELEALLEKNDVEALQERFSQRLEFGTAGLRGILGAGPNRMNRLVVQQTAAGLARYMHACDSVLKSVVIGYDARKNSRMFAHDAARVLSAQGFHVFLFENVVPTPVLAYAVRSLKTGAGIMVTASHNPPEYNGLKVYWGNGAQIIEPHDRFIAEHIEHVAADELFTCFTQDIAPGPFIEYVSNELIQEYLKQIAQTCVQLPLQASRDICIAYTAMHGVGGACALNILNELQFKNVQVVKSQVEPDPHFSTVTFPNPEEPNALKLLIEQCKESQATVGFANDPDADRLAMVIQNNMGDYISLTGDQIGALIAHCFLQFAKPGDCVGTTIVSSRLLARMATAHGAHYFETLTGFKWLEHEAMQREARHERVLFCYEEAIGFSTTPWVKDKDGISALGLLACYVRDCASRGTSVYQELMHIYATYGLFLTQQKTFKTQHAHEAAEKMRTWRSHAPESIQGIQVVKIIDYQTSTSLDCRTQTTSAILLPQSNVLQYFLADDTRITIRPSGTEPKIKFYYEHIYQISINNHYEKVYENYVKQQSSFIEHHQASLSYFEQNN